MAADKNLEPLVLGIDAEGTMTDTFIVDVDGRFTVGKAATTPHDESIGFIASAHDAAMAWELSPDELFAALEVTLYSGTALLNTLLTHTGRRLGLLITRGFEDAVMMGTGIHVWDGYDYSDRLHAVTHVPPKLLVPGRHRTDRPVRQGRRSTLRIRSRVGCRSAARRGHRGTLHLLPFLARESRP